MSFIRRIKAIWLTAKDIRALKREGVTDPEELRRRAFERAMQRETAETGSKTHSD